jgi:hypothetical protein
MSGDFRQTPQFRRGRLGEILQFNLYLRLGCQMFDLSDRTHNRAPLIYGGHGLRTVISPDTFARKTADFLPEFKTKTQHQQWNGGSQNDAVRVSARVEEGIDRSKFKHYLEVQKMLGKPVVLSILSIKEATIIAATLQQLGEPRFSPNRFYKFVNWDIRRFNLIATLDPKRLDRFFYSDNAKLKDLRQCWLEGMPAFHEVKRVLDWMRPEQREFEILRQFIFDQIERDWAA